MILYLDTETFSPTPLARGVHAYAEKAKVLMTSWAIDEATPTVEDGWSKDAQYACGQAKRIIVHNSHFDRTVIRHAEGYELPLPKLWDTLAQARGVGMPGGLGKLCEILKVPIDQAKDKTGKELINLFCKPQARTGAINTKETHPEKWAEFRTYAGHDIDAMRAVYRRLPKWNYENKIERALWELDQKINDRGFAVDVDLATSAVAAVAREKARLAARCTELTLGEVEAATQRDKLLGHLLGFYGVSLPDLQKGTLERRIGDETLPDIVRELLAIRLEAGGTASSKYKRLIDGVSADGRLRGTLEYCGAARTGRWAGRMFQPQNLPRPWLDEDEINNGIEAIKSDVADLVIDNVSAVATNAIRGCIVAPEGQKLLIADLSNIEGRVLAWLAGEEWKLEAFREYDAGVGHDLYLITAGGILNKSPSEVTKRERQDYGKVPELACGYQGAVGAFDSMAQALGVVIPGDDVLPIVKAWRKKNSEIVKFWYELGDLAIFACNNPGSTIDCRKLKLRRDGAWLRILLPSGRALCYPSPRVEPKHQCPACKGSGEEQIYDFTYVANDPDPLADPLSQTQSDGDERCFECFGRGYKPAVLSYAGVNAYTRQWSRIDTYGGKLVENVTQAVARDVLASNMLRVEEGNYPFEIALTVHDEIIAEAPDSDEYTHHMLAEIMAIPPSWAQDLPLAAGGFEAKRYRKG